MNNLQRVLLIAVTAVLLPGCFFYTTGPNEIGVKVYKYGFLGSSGVSDEIFAPGMTHFYLPVVTEFRTFDAKLQNMEMTVTRGRGDISGRDDLLFKTIDGNDTSLDVIITYRIIPEKAPYVLQYVATTDSMLRKKIVRTIARSKPRDIFGELSTEEFYVAQKREQKSLEAKQRLNDILEPYGVTVERVSTKDYRFSEAYQKAIEDRKVADQQAEKNKAGAKASEEEWLKKLQDAQAEVNKNVAEADGQLRQAKVEADAYFEKHKKIAEAIRVEGRNEARSIRKMNEALAGRGGKVMVKLQVAEALKGKRFMILPSSGYNIKNMDMNQLLETYGIKSLNKKENVAQKSKKSFSKKSPASKKN